MGYKTVSKGINTVTISAGKVFTLDLRSLGIARILLATILLYDLVTRFQYLTLHYGVNSVLPPELLFDQFIKPGAFTFHLLTDHTGWLYLLFGVKMFCYLGLLLGYKTRLSTFLSWIFLMSLHNANPLVLNSGDAYLRLLLFWAMFLPWGTWYSMDSLKNSSDKPKQFFGISSIAFILQICFVYLFTGLLKSSPEWLTEGTAITYALSLQQFSKPLGSWLLQYPDLLKWMTFGTVLIEILAPIFILYPKWNSATKSIAIAVLISFHLGIYATMMVGTFSFVCIAALFAIIPYAVWEKIFNSSKESFTNPAKVNLPKKNPIVYTYFMCTCLVVVFLWNLSTLLKVQTLPKSIEYPAYFLRLDQNWRMFAPTVYKDDGWFTFEAIMDNDARIDLFQKDGKVINNSPQNWLFMYRNYARWRKFFLNMRNERNPGLYEAVAKSFIYHFTEDETELNALEIYYYLDWSNVGYKNFVDSELIYELDFLSQER